ncbi:pirin family protein [Rhodococcus aerolatus]
MPAVTVRDTTVLDRVAEPALTELDRPVVSVTTAPRGFEGEGFPVRRAFAGVDLRLLDPFIHLDQMGEVEYAPGEPKGTSWHPHRGFETVTYMIDGIMDHADDHGGGGSITDGATQWMTAGGGVLHKEAPPEHLVASGGLFHGLQLWVNLPRAQKLIAPRYQDLGAGDSALLTSADGGALVRVIAGDVRTTTGTASGPGSTTTPMAMLHATLAPGAELALPWRADFNALVYVLSGDGRVGPAGQPVGTGQLAVLGAGGALRISADAVQDARHGALDVVVLGGTPLREPIAWAGPFVMNTEAEVHQAFADFRAGRLGQVPAHAHPGLHGSA